MVTLYLYTLSLTNVWYKKSRKQTDIACICQLMHEGKEMKQNQSLQHHTTISLNPHFFVPQHPIFAHKLLDPLMRIEEGFGVGRKVWEELKVDVSNKRVWAENPNPQKTDH